MEFKGLLQFFQQLHQQVEDLEVVLLMLILVEVVDQVGVVPQPVLRQVEQEILLQQVPFKVIMDLEIVRVFLEVEGVEQELQLQIKMEDQVQQIVFQIHLLQDRAEVGVELEVLIQEQRVRVDQVEVEQVRKVEME
jgi:hypothetical protein